MARITSKLQVTIPRLIADAYGLEPGMDIEFIAAGDSIRVLPGGTPPASEIPEKLRLFDAATARQRRRNAIYSQTPRKIDTDRGWTREELYVRERSR